MHGGALVLLTITLVVGVLSRQAEGSQNGADIDTEHIFGFIEGSDLGKKGEQEVEVVPTVRWGKQSGSYLATSTPLLFKYSVTDNFRVAPLISFASHNISNVPGLVDRDQFEVEGSGAEIRYRLLDRERAPFGFTLSVDPQWNRIDASTGDRVSQLALPLIALFDKELMPKRLFAAINLAYEPEWTRHSERVSTVAVGGALSTSVVTGVFIGGEVRYERRYDGISLDRFAGEALFVGRNCLRQAFRKGVLLCGVERTDQGPCSG